MLSRHGITGSLLLLSVLAGCGGGRGETGRTGSLESLAGELERGNREWEGNTSAPARLPSNVAPEQIHDVAVERLAADLRMIPDPSEQIWYLVGLLEPPGNESSDIRHIYNTACWEIARQELAGRDPARVVPILLEGMELSARDLGTSPIAERVLIDHGSDAVPYILDRLRKGYDGIREREARKRRVAHRQVLVRALGKIADPVARESLGLLLVEDPAWEVRQYAVLSLARMRPQRIVNYLAVELLWKRGQDNEQTREFARVTLARIYRQDLGYDPARWITMFDGLYDDMRRPFDVLLEAAGHDELPVFQTHVLTTLRDVSGLHPEGRAFWDPGPYAAWKVEDTRRTAALLLPVFEDEDARVRNTVLRELPRFVGVDYGNDIPLWRNRLGIE